IIIGLIAALGWFYLNNLEAFTREKITPLAKLKDTVKAVEDITMVKGTISSPIDIFKESISNPDKITKGKTLFETNCSSCHGTEGKGDGIAGKTLNPPPRNFHDLTGWTNGQAFSKMFRTLQEGIIARGMASYSSIPVEDRIEIIHYIRTFRNDFPAIEQSELKELDKAYSLSSGIKQPSQIPVKIAEEKILKEDSVNLEKVESIVNKIKTDNTNKAAEKFKETSFDLNRSVSAFASSKKWNENETQFVKFVTTDPKSKGFKSSAITLSSEDWGLLFIYVKSLF
ncbi:MAG: cytochrome c, partial [Ignavibacteriae bacterium]|nr:cytochrome c [Ignavibacteriota bacterium]